MNCTVSEAQALAEAVRASVFTPGVDVLVCPPFTALHTVAVALVGSRVALGAQNMYLQDGGAFTGEISGAMLLDAGCSAVILGHSERRHQMAETDDQVQAKLRLALRLGLMPIVCVGETLTERQAGSTEAVIGRQVASALAGLDEADAARLQIAYEPVWAIGTGQVATPDQANEVHCFVRGLLPSFCRQTVRILYGGSVTPSTAPGLLSCPDIDGALVGGASLQAEAFAAIVAAAGVPLPA